jgi:hypothetical protein
MDFDWLPNLRVTKPKRKRPGKNWKLCFCGCGFARRNKRRFLPGHSPYCRYEITGVKHARRKRSKRNREGPVPSVAYRACATGPYDVRGLSPTALPGSHESVPESLNILLPGLLYVQSDR